MIFVQKRSRFMPTIFALFSLAVVPSLSMAQHCPFDGSVMVMAQLIDEKGGTVKDIDDGLVLQEVDNDSPELCTYSPQLVTKPMMEGKKAFYGARNEDSMNRILDVDCSDCTFLDEGYFGAMLGQSTENCMIRKNPTDFTYKKRKYEIWFAHNGTVEKVPVPEERMYSLCTGTGNWSRIAPIQIKVKSRKS